MIIIDCYVMSKAASKFQEAFMSRIYRGKEVFKPLNTGWIDARVACVREYVANIFFYTKNGTTIMIDAGYYYERLKEKMGWLDLDPSSIRHILITSRHRSCWRGGEGQRSTFQRGNALHRRD